MAILPLTHSDKYLLVLASKKESNDPHARHLTVFLLLKQLLSLPILCFILAERFIPRIPSFRATKFVSVPRYGKSTDASQKRVGSTISMHNRACSVEDG